MYYIVLGHCLWILDKRETQRHFLFQPYLTPTCFSSMLDWDFNSKPVTGWANSILLAHVMFNIQWDPICLLFMKPDMFDRFSQAEVKQKEFEDGTVREHWLKHSPKLPFTAFVKNREWVLHNKISCFTLI